MRSLLHLLISLVLEATVSRRIDEAINLTTCFSLLVSLSAAYACFWLFHCWCHLPLPCHNCVLSFTSQALLEQQPTWTTHSFTLLSFSCTHLVIINVASAFIFWTRSHSVGKATKKVSFLKRFFSYLVFWMHAITVITIGNKRTSLRSYRWDIFA